MKKEDKIKKLKKEIKRLRKEILKLQDKRQKLKKLLEEEVLRELMADVEEIKKGQEELISSAKLKKELEVEK